MNPSEMSEVAAQPLTAGARADLAADRLARNRERLSGWFEQDRQNRAERLSAGWLAGSLWPVLKGLSSQPVASLALGALTQGMLPRTPGAPAPALQTFALGAALGVVRRYPKTSLTVAAAAGVALLWSRRRHRPPP